MTSNFSEHTVYINKQSDIECSIYQLKTKTLYVNNISLINLNINKEYSNNLYISRIKNTIVEL